MIKKLAAGIASTAMFFALATPAFAGFTLVKVTNFAGITNNVSLSSNTGVNSMVGTGFIGGVKGSSIVTANAQSSANVQNQVNGTSVDTCGLCLSMTSVHAVNFAGVTNNVSLSANTGNNSMVGTGFIGGVQGSVISAGGAVTAGTVVNNINTTVVGDL